MPCGLLCATTISRHHMERFLLISTLLLSSGPLALGQGFFPAPVFGDNGCVDYFMGPQAASAEGITHVHQPDGKVIIGGHSVAPGNVPTLAMVRIEPICGQLDSSFGDNGRVVTFFEFGTRLHDMILQPDGKILGCGQISLPGFAEQAAVFRFNQDGSPDLTFNSGSGFRLLPIPGTTASANMAHTIMLDELGRILVFARGNPVQFAVFRMLPDGAPDASYGDNGMALLSFPYTPNHAFASAALDAQGRVVMAGAVGTGPFDPYVLGLARFTANGSVDNSFGINGQVQFPERPLFPTYAVMGAKAMELGVLSDGRIVVTYGHSVSSVQRMLLAAFHTDGSIDGTFGVDGLFEQTDGAPWAGGLEILDDDHILLFYKHHWNNGPAAVAKVTPNGTFDTGFGTNGSLLAPYGPQFDFRGFQDGFLLANGHILAYGGKFNSGISIARLTTDPMADALPVISFDYPDLVVTGGGSFQWLLDGVAIPGATGNNHTPSSNGTYTVTMDLEACSFTSPPYVMLTTGIAEGGRTGITLVNNPADDALLIENAGGNTPWEIIDMRGARVAEGNLVPGRNRLAVEKLKPGMYLLRTSVPGMPLRFVKE